MLPETALDQAAMAAKRLAAAMRGLAISSDPPLVGLTDSIGVGELTGAAHTVDSIIEWIDKAAYRAKAEGRDRIEVCREDAAGALRQ